MNEEILQKISDFITQNQSNIWMSEFFSSLNIDLQFQIVDAICDLIENKQLSIEEATSLVFTDLAQQMGIQMR